MSECYTFFPHGNPDIHQIVTCIPTVGGFRQYSAKYEVCFSQQRSVEDIWWRISENFGFSWCNNWVTNAKSQEECGSEFYLSYCLMSQDSNISQFPLVLFSFPCWKCAILKECKSEKIGMLRKMHRMHAENIFWAPCYQPAYDSESRSKLTTWNSLKAVLLPFYLEMLQSFSFSRELV